MVLLPWFGQVLTQKSNSASASSAEHFKSSSASMETSKPPKPPNTTSKWLKKQVKRLTQVRQITYHLYPLAILEFWYPAQNIINWSSSFWCSDCYIIASLRYISISLMWFVEIEKKLKDLLDMDNAWILWILNPPFLCRNPNITQQLHVEFLAIQQVLDNTWLL